MPSTSCPTPSLHNGGSNKPAGCQEIPGGFHYAQDMMLIVALMQAFLVKTPALDRIHAFLEPQKWASRWLEQITGYVYDRRKLDSS